jgi:hypothetical protein
MMSLSFQKTQRRVRPDFTDVTLDDVYNLSQEPIREAYNDFKHDVDSDSWQVTLFTILQEIPDKPVEPDKTRACRSREEKQAHVKLL